MLVVGCGDSETSTVDGTGSGTGAGATTGGGGSTTSNAGGGGDGGSVAGGGGAGAQGGEGGGGGAGGVPIVCPGAPLEAGEHAATIDFDGRTRDYEVQVPASYNNTTAVPLVLDLHGYTNSATLQQGWSGWDELAEAEGLVVVRPEGFGALQSWNAGDGCCGMAQAQDIDDVGLMKAIVDVVKTQLCIDPRRVYATGLSNGGAMSHRLACEAADVFAAVAPVSYPLDFSPNSKCQPSRPIAIIHSHGTGDLVVPYNGNFTAQPAPDSFAYWGEVNGCTGVPVETYSLGASHCDTYQNCQGGVEVTLCTVDGGHLLYTNNDAVPIAEVSWDFLSQHTLP